MSPYVDDALLKVDGRLGLLSESCSPVTALAFIGSLGCASKKRPMPKSIPTVAAATIPTEKRYRRIPTGRTLAARGGVDVRVTRTGSSGLLPISESTPDDASSVLGKSAGSGEFRDARLGCAPLFGARSSVNGLAEV
jgi:hypothetical protein